MIKADKIAQALDESQIPYERDDTVHGTGIQIDGRTGIAKIVCRNDGLGEIHVYVERAESDDLDARCSAIYGDPSDLMAKLRIELQRLGVIPKPSGDRRALSGWGTKGGRPPIPTQGTRRF